jgi:hypothetical protein
MDFHLPDRFTAQDEVDGWMALVRVCTLSLAIIYHITPSGLTAGLRIFIHHRP